MQGAYTSGLRAATDLSTVWMDETLPPAMRNANKDKEPNPTFGKGMPLPSSGIPEAMDRIVAGKDLSQDSEGLLEALEKETTARGAPVAKKRALSKL